MGLGSRAGCTGADAQLVGRLWGGAVARDLEGAAERVLGLLVAAAGKPGRRTRHDGRVEIAKNRAGGVSTLQCRRVDDRLEGGAGLPRGLGRAVEAAGKLGT